MQFGSSLPVEFLKSGLYYPRATSPKVLIHRDIQSGRINKVLVGCTLIPLFLHHPLVAGFSQGFDTVVASVLNGRGYSPAFQPLVPDFSHIGNARLWVFFLTHFCLNQQMYELFVTVYFIKNYLPCRVSVTLFVFLVEKSSYY